MTSRPSRSALWHRTQHPDTFVAHLIGLDPEVVCAAIRRMHERYKNPPMTAAEYLDSLEKKGLTQ